MSVMVAGVLRVGGGRFGEPLGNVPPVRGQNRTRHGGKLSVFAQNVPNSNFCNVNYGLNEGVWLH